jgi:hypothetical protein
MDIAHHLLVKVIRHHRQGIVHRHQAKVIPHLLVAVIHPMVENGLCLPPINNKFLKSQT